MAFKCKVMYVKKINTLKKNMDFERIIHNNKAFKYKDYVIYIERNNEKSYHFGICVSKKIGNAVTRNKYRRRIKNIIDKNVYQNGFNCIIILGKGILARSYSEMEKNLMGAFNKLNIIKERNDAQ